LKICTEWLTNPAEMPSGPSVNLLLWILLPCWNRAPSYFWEKNWKLKILR